MSRKESKKQVKLRRRRSDSANLNIILKYDGGKRAKLSFNHRHPVGFFFNNNNNKKNDVLSPSNFHLLPPVYTLLIRSYSLRLTQFCIAR